MGVLTTLDLVIFLGSLVLIMVIGLWVGRKEDTSDDYFLAGKNARWWGVAGSIFGSNVSANHLIGMMGVGFAFGFAQSHFEFTAIVGLLALCYLFLPVYRKLNVQTLSEYLGRRYNDGSRVCYALIMVVIMVVIQMVPGFYIGSRTTNLLLKSDSTARAVATVSETGTISEVRLLDGGTGYAGVPSVSVNLDKPTADKRTKTIPQDASFKAVVEGGVVTGIQIVSGGEAYEPLNGNGEGKQEIQLKFSGGASFDEALSPGDVDPTWYWIVILLLALITGTYTILGGLKAVIATDVIQSILVLASGLIVAYVVFSLPEVGGWAGMVADDAASNGGVERLHLYNAADHPKLPWTGVLSGLMILHFYYWGTNQFIVQRALAARSLREARIGIISAGFFKLLIPFFSIGTGIAAYYYFRKQGVDVAQDAVFSKLLTDLIAPIGFGLAGLVAAGVIGAILSSLDSMMNSAATIVTFDVYKRYINPDASEKSLILMGRIWIAVFIAFAALLTIVTMDPNSEDSFFLYVAEHQGNLVTGVVVAFVVGMAWKGATAAGALVSIVGGVVLCYTIPSIYANFIGSEDSYFGPTLNFFHTAFIAAVFCLILHVGISLLTSKQVSEEKSKLTWTGLGIFDPAKLKVSWASVALALIVFGILAVAMVFWSLSPTIAGLIAGLTAFVLFALGARRDVGGSLIANDKFWAGLLGGCAAFMMYYFY